MTCDVTNICVYKQQTNNYRRPLLLLLLLLLLLPMFLLTSLLVMAMIMSTYAATAKYQNDVIHKIILTAARLVATDVLFQL